MMTLIHCAQAYGLKAAVYTGRQDVPTKFRNNLDYFKIGPYIEEYGPLTDKGTNQRLYEREGITITDITSRFWV